MAGFRSGIVCRWSVALRSKPHKDPEHPHQGIIADLPRGTPVEVTGQQGGWLAIKVTLQGKALHGYVSKETVAPTRPDTSKIYYEFVPHGDV
ncbi:SH3 domain-containing protein [Corallococcus exiguus]|uniref:SH3 domain-containing protein n=1 Tax=Corallococcus exiguus TaxID=83462 RepID=UPI003977B350